MKSIYHCLSVLLVTITFSSTASAAPLSCTGTIFTSNYTCTLAEQADPQNSDPASEAALVFSSDRVNWINRAVGITEFGNANNFSDFVSFNGQNITLYSQSTRPTAITAIDAITFAEDASGFARFDALYRCNGECDFNNNPIFTAHIIVNSGSDSQVPEPASLTLLALGMLGFAASRRQRK